MSVLSRLPTTRSQVSSQTIAAKDAIGYYTRLNSEFLRTVGVISSLSSVGEVANYSSSYVSFLKSKERAGIERAVLANTFGADRFGPGMYQKLITLIGAQNNYVDAFLTLSNEEQIQFFNSTMSGEFIDETKRMREIALDKALFTLYCHIHRVSADAGNEFVATEKRERSVFLIPESHLVPEG